MKKEGNPIRLLVIFIIIVFVLALISLGYKFFNLIKESEIRGSTYSILLIDNDARLIHIDKANKNMRVFVASNLGKEFSEKSKLAASLDFNIPIDAVISSTDASEFDRGEVGLNTFVNSLLSQRRYKMKNMNEWDILKINLAIGSIARDARKMEDVSYVQNDGGVRRIDINDYSDFRDGEIFNSKLSVEIVNSTGINGFGNRVATLLSNIGFNVVDIANGDYDKSGIFIRKVEDKENDIVKRIGNIFDFGDVSHDADIIADIAVVLGRDMASEFK